MLKLSMLIIRLFTIGVVIGCNLYQTVVEIGA